MASNENPVENSSTLAESDVTPPVEESSNLIEPSAASSSNDKSSASHSEQPSVVDVDENLTTGSYTMGSYSSWWGNSFNSILQTAKEKSKTALELIKTDLAEFKTTMASDTNNIINQLTNINLANSTIINNLNKTFSASEDDGQGGLTSRLFSGTGGESTTAGPGSSVRNVPLTTSSSSIYDRYLNELRSLQTNQATYLTDPSDEATFADFQTSFDSDSYKSVISDLLIENAQMRLLYSQLVPAQMSNNLFWSRYFFKVNQLEEEHRKRVKLIERATSTSNANSSSTQQQDHLDWGDDDDKPAEDQPAQLNSEKSQSDEQIDNQVQDDKKPTIKPEDSKTPLSH